MAAAVTLHLARRMAGPVATGIALAGAAAVVAVRDSSQPGSRLIPCPFHAATGLWCPGCGVTRATHDLLHGDLAAALSTNVFTPLFLALVAGAWWAWARTSWGRPRSPWWTRLPDASATWFLVALVVYGIARNVPLTPFTALGP